MPIYAPGIRDRHNRPAGKKGRNVVAMLSLTAMVDMFTVLVVFLLQNYQTTGEVLEINDEVKLPIASAVKELRPAHVVIISKEQLILDQYKLATFEQIKAQPDWKIENLFNRLTDAFRQAEDRRRASGLGTLKEAVNETKQNVLKADPKDDRRVTVQADKEIDFLTIKKVMYTITEAGASEINFAVIKEEQKQ